MRNHTSQPKEEGKERAGYIVETHAVNFAYTTRQLPAVQQLSLQIPKGVTFGLLGQNGAGKSTVLKLITGLLPPDTGSVELFGQRLPAHHRQVCSRMGILIEEPPLYPHLSGWENLKISCLYRHLSFQRIEEVLAIVQMEEMALKKVSHYSTGMKQRLGVALALLPDPDLLILDEPTNGMDPQGIIDMRNLIQRLQQQTGKTTILSSHLLHEVELVCDYVGIIQQGRLLYQGSVSDLKQQYASHQEIFLDISDNLKAYQILLAHGFDMNQASPLVSFFVPHMSAITQAIDVLREAQLEIYQIGPKEASLEDLYLHLTEKAHAFIS